MSVRHITKPSILIGLASVAALVPTGTASAQAGLVAWGANDSGQCNVPALPAGVQCTDVVTGWRQAIATRSDGSAVAWGTQAFIPAPPAGVTYVQFAAGDGHSLALRSDGNITAWGINDYGQTTVPTPPPGTTFVQVAAGSGYSVARVSDGTLMAWGRNHEGQLHIPSLPIGVNYIDVKTAFFNNLARRSDGAWIAWGFNSVNQNAIPTPPPGLTYVDIAIGYEHMIGLRSDGTAVGWGNNNFGQAALPVLPPGMKYLQVAAGYEHSFALRSDGVLIGAGRNNVGQLTFPPPTGPYFRYATIASGMHFGLAIVEPNDPVAYCTAKVNSQGCAPSIWYTGLPNLSGPDDFHVLATSVLSQRPGMLLWSLTPSAVPFYGGTMCLAAPITRTAGQNSGGTPSPALDCTGVYDYHFTHSYMMAQLLPPSTKLYAQYWTRDPGFALPNNIGLTDGLAFVIGP